MTNNSSQDSEKIDKVITAIRSYKEFLLDLDDYINNSGYKASFLADKMGMHRGTFYKKKKRGNWTLDEAEKLAELLRINE